MKKRFSKVMASLLCVAMLLSVVSVTAFADISINYTEREDDYYKVISKDDYNLAPGIVESEIVLNNAEGSHRQVAHVVEVDLSNPYAKIIPSYKGMAEALANKDYGVEIMSKQAAYAEANGYGNVVAAMNLSLSWYDSAYYLANPDLVGEPLGYMVLDGVVYMNSQGQTSGAQTCVVVNFDEKDGEARPADMPKVEIRSTSTAITGWEEQVIPANFGFLVKDGKNQYSKNHTSDPASRSFVGIKADGTFVMVMNDGRQAPYSTGFNSYEMAEFMLSLGCVVAVNGDGGGSSAFLSQRPGEELKVNCAPSDGAERDTTHGILVISTAPATGEFVRATISAEYDYYTPGSTVAFSAVGSDLVGTAAEIPADVQWQLADASFGTIENGVFVSNGQTGTVTAQMVYNGSVVGEASVEIVIPEKIEFTQSSIVVPFGKTAQLSVLATINEGIHQVTLKEGDITLTLDNNDLGTLDGTKFTFAAVAEEDAPATLTGTLTATLNHGEGLVITVPFSIGKGSDIIYDFEDQDLTGWSIFTNYGQYGPKGPNGSVTDANGNYWYHGQNERGYISIVDSTTGLVRNGNYSLKVECDFTQIYETGYHALNLRFPVIDCTDSLQVGFWLYIPYDARHAEMKIGSTNIGNGQFYEFNEGWHYIKAQAKDNQLTLINISIDDRAPDTNYNNYSHITEGNLNGKYTFYIDDITVDYSTAVDDRENPVFGDVELISNDSNTALNGSLVTVTDNNLSFEVKVADDNTLGNSTGLNANTASAYIDGKKVDCTFLNGKISAANVVLSDGIHDIRFEIADNAGNSMWAGGKINVATGTDTSSTIKVVPADSTVTRPLIGSLYWMDVIATDIETIEKVELVFDLNNASSWELKGMKAAEGFTASYAIQADDNIATIIIEKTGEVAATGEAELLTFPVRTWVSTITEYEGYENQTPATLVSRGIIWKQSIELYLEKGIITYVEDYEATTIGTFNMEDLIVETEIFFTNYTRTSVEGAQDWINEKKAAGVGFHEHTETAVADVEATCTTAGCTGQTYCAVCDSVVDWGTEVAPAGHSFDVAEDGIKTCEDCGDTFYYVGGEAIVGWYTVDGTVYYADENGVLVNNDATIDGITYTFVDFALSAPALVSDGVGYIGYWAGEEMEAGWHTLNGKQYYVMGIYVSTGITRIGMTVSVGMRYHLFDDNGVLQTDFTGIIEYKGQLHFAVNGICASRNLQADSEGNLYFINSNYIVETNKEIYLDDTMTNGLVAAGTYYFNYVGKMVDEKPEGITLDDDGEVRFYVDGAPTRAGLVQDAEGNYYYFNSALKAVKNCKYGVSITNGLLPVGVYEFGADGKMIVPEEDKVKNGLVVDDDGEVRFYENDVAMRAGLVQDAEGNYYYINSTLKAVKSCKYGVSITNGLLPVGIYEFGADGKMIQNG